jgi:hypothetical protein
MAIDMIDAIGRPLAGHIQPRQPMCLIKLIINPYATIPVAIVGTARDITGAGVRAGADQARENARLRIVAEYLT